MMECSKIKPKIILFTVVVDIFVVINMIIKSTQNHIEMTSIPD